jgi:type II secretory pathway pseudopilin PulG
MRLMRRRGGFSLVEAVVASAVLLLTCAAVSGTLMAALRAERVARQRSALEEMLEAETARLTSLPFFVAVAPPAGDVPGDIQPPSLLSVVFPHARPESNSQTACYCDGRGSGTPGSFVTLVESDGVLLRRETQFVVGEGTTLDVVTPSALDGWAVWASRPVPATTVQIELTARSGNRTASIKLLLHALRARVAPSATPVGGSAQSG